MKMSLRFTAGALLALTMQAVCFAQHYNQTNLVSNTSGVASVTDPQLINPWGISRGSGSPWWVSDNAFHLVSLRKQHFDEDSADHDNGHSAENSFVDENLPRNYVPFNVQVIGNDIVVTYVLHEEGSRFETDGPGLGFVDIYSSTGRLLQRLEHGDWLNAPWGVVLAPLDFGRFSHDLLIGQFAGGGDTQSSGFIAAYDLATGKFDGLLQDASGKPLAINGIWALSPGNVSP